MTIKVSKEDLVLIDRGVSIINSSRDLMERRLDPNAPKFSYMNNAEDMKSKHGRTDVLKMALSGEVRALYKGGKLFALGFADLQGEPCLLRVQNITKWTDGICHCVTCETLRKHRMDDPNMDNKKFKEKIVEVFPEIMIAQLEEGMMEMIGEVEKEASAFKDN